MKPWSHDWLIGAGAYPGFCSMKRLGVFLLPLDGMLAHRRPLPHNLLRFPNKSLVPIYTPGWREALWELSVLTKNTTQCPWPGLKPGQLERTNHVATAPPYTCIMKGKCFCQKTYIYLINFNPLMPVPPVTAHDELWPFFLFYHYLQSKLTSPILIFCSGKDLPNDTQIRVEHGICRKMLGYWVKNSEQNFPQLHWASPCQEFPISVMLSWEFFNWKQNSKQCKNLKILISAYAWAKMFSEVTLVERKPCCHVANAFLAD